MACPKPSASREPTTAWLSTAAPPTRAAAAMLLLLLLLLLPAPKPPWPP
jgi:hypothetical protein